GGRGMSSELRGCLKQAVLGDCAPHLTLYLDVTPELGVQRARARGDLDRIEQEALHFFTRTRVRSLALASGVSRSKTVAATQPRAT
ncbi:nucleoside/nucleotide kinase family protein, partial [Erwinia amylovora]|nr:dTMP kinase [Erwinia amylovora]